MTTTIQSAFTLAAVMAVIIGAIYYLETQKPNSAGETDVTELSAQGMPIEEKSKKFEKAKELVSPNAFINSDPFELQDIVGKQIILVDFWTYSCINCQRTLPYLNAWQEKYGDKGLTIVGVHTPEFAFEQELSNVQAAVDKFGITYPVALDNEYATWRAYNNRYWPRKYLVDIDGYIVYDHIGEGAYEETERKIQELLAERAERLGSEESIAQDIARPENVLAPGAGVRSPEVYFGSARNELLRNGTPFMAGTQTLAAPDDIRLNQLHLVGEWNIQPEYAENVGTPASIVFRYQAKDVYMVASAGQPVTLSIKQDGVLLDKKITVQQDQLYVVMENPAAGEHTLELIPESGGLKAFTFTFG